MKFTGPALIKPSEIYTSCLPRDFNIGFFTSPIYRAIPDEKTKAKYADVILGFYGNARLQPPSQP